MNKEDLICYWYPGKIYIKPGGTCAINTYYLDQLSKEEKYIRLTYFKVYLMKTYNLDYGEYYNIVVEGDINASHKCVICGNNTNFIKLSKGYASTCSRWCHNKLAITKAVSQQSYVKKHINAMMHWNSIARASMNRFKTRYHGKKGYFYIAISLDLRLIKFGVTTNPVSSRVSYQSKDKQEFGFGFPFDVLTIHAILFDDVDNIANLEYYIKCNYRDSKETKTISELPNIFKLIKTYLSSI